MELVGRENERNSATRSIRFGNGVVIVGDGGVGKSALAAAVAGSAGEPGSAPVKLLATAAGRRIPYAALAPLVPLDATNLHPALVPGLMLRRLAELGGNDRPVLVVDDAHWLDDHSASALLTVIAQGGARVLVTVRSGGRPSPAVVALWKERLLDRIDLLPFTLAEAGTLLRARLGGDVAAMTTQFVWEQSRGNALYLTELARYGVRAGRLAESNGVWWWSGGTDVPPRLAELLLGRLEGLSPAAAEGVDALALAEPLPYDTLAAVCSTEAILELDRRGVVESDTAGGVVRLRIAHPLLRAAVDQRLSPARRRTVAGRLLAAPADHVDLLRRATWEEAAGGVPDVDLLVQASRSMIVLDATAAVRMAQRALPHDEGPDAAVALADAQAELGHADQALDALTTARDRIRDADDRATVGLSEAALHLWSLRRPGEALSILERLAAELPANQVDEAMSAKALLTLFYARPADAGRIVDRVLRGHPGPAALRRCLMVQVAVATLADRPAQARKARSDLADVLRRYPQPASARSLSTAFAATAEIFGDRTTDLPRAGGRSGRWPAPHQWPDPPDRVGPPVGAGPVWPLLAGVSHHLAGDHRAATMALREATVQQLQGEGLFRSEATAGLAVVLAEEGQLAQARKALCEPGPDDVAVIPGLYGWARAWILAGEGRVRAAGELAVRTARETAAAGALTTALWYLADAGRMGAEAPAAQAAEALAADVESDLSVARLMGIRARWDGRVPSLIAAADAHLAVGVFGHAAELADLAIRRATGSRSRTTETQAEHARQIAARARSELGRSVARPALPEQLTRRETEVARLAAQGLRDKDIADELQLSVRTVESHLATAYRKLRIASRRDLIDVLGGRPAPR